jgi:hypothetical protein
LSETHPAGVNWGGLTSLAVVAVVLSPGAPATSFSVLHMVGELDLLGALVHEWRPTYEATFIEQGGRYLNIVYETFVATGNRIGNFTVLYSKLCRP